MITTLLTAAAGVFTIFVGLYATYRIAFLAFLYLVKLFKAVRK